jgi:hypothetical protein
MGRRMMGRGVFRFVPYTVEQDPHTAPTYQAWCGPVPGQMNDP